MNVIAATAQTSVRPQRAGPAPENTAFACVDIFSRFEDAEAAWRKLERFGSPYQTFAFCRAWSETIGAAEGSLPLMAIARDIAGEPLALLPLGLSAWGPLRVARFLGGRMANYQMGLFRSDALISPEEMRRLLRAVAGATRPRLDVFALNHQPETWRGSANPLLPLGAQASPSFAYASDVSGGGDAWLDAHFSKASLKKLRKKAAKLEAFGQIRLQRAQTPEEIEICLDAFLAQKRLRMRELGMGDEFERPGVVAFLRRLSGLDGGEPCLEWRAWRAGESFAALLAGLPYRGRLSALLLSHDRAPELSSASPGKQLILALAPALAAEGFDSFDLGVGDAQYKEECCEIVEPLFDVVCPMTIPGRAAAAAFRIQRSVKRRIKQSPRLFALASRIRRGLND